MPSAVPRWPVEVRAAVALIAALTVWRLVWLPAATLDLFVDEAQYWLWGREMAAGAWSKPPLVGWIIRAATDLAGSDAPWVLRAPWPLVHGAAALAVLALGRRVAGDRVGALAGLSYATLPAVSLGSILISTDSPMLLALALALWLGHRLHGTGRAIVLGIAVAAGMWAKYAMLFALAGWVLAALADPAWRMRRRDAVVAALVAGVLFAPNVLWNLRNDLATVRHTAANAEAAGSPDWAGLAEFVASQLAVAGPLVALALAFGWARRWPEGLRGLSVMAAVILGIVCAQALRGGANANWAVGAYVPGVIVASAVLAARPWLAWASLALNGLIALALPLVATQAETLRLPSGKLVMARYVGQAAISRAALDEARRAGARLIVSDDRALLADLFYRTQRRDGVPDIAVRAVPTRPADSHYALRYPLSNETGPALWLSRAGHLPDCAGPAMRWTPAEGVAKGAVLELAPLPAPCLDQIRSMASAMP